MTDAEADRLAAPYVLALRARDAVLAPKRLLRLLVKEVERETRQAVAREAAMVP